MWQKLKNIYHLAQAVIANIIYCFPSLGFTVIAVTGTDGKTTTVNLIFHILKQAGFNVSMVSSTGAVVQGKEYPLAFHVTTPSSFGLQRFFRKAKSGRGKKYMVLEVTSHALDQNRILGIPIEIAVLTNVTHEHLDYHRTYKNYVYAKAKLLSMGKKVIVNADDKSFTLISSLKGKSIKGEFITYGKGANTKVNPSNLKVKTSLIGDFNLYNFMAAVGVCRSLGIDAKIIQKSLENFTLPEGREEIVFDKDFKVMIDFAHTPNALEQVLSSLRPLVEGKIIHVFGSAGLRDHSKRKMMGEVSSRFSDIVILTAEDPRTEDIEDIISQIYSGIDTKKQGKVFKIKDRQEAITKAVGIAQKGDLVLLTGKGHEKSMNLGKGEVIWSEHEAVKKALDLRYGKK